MELLLEDKLVEHLNGVDDEANEQIELIIRQTAWVGTMNNIRNAVEAIVLSE